MCLYSDMRFLIFACLGITSVFATRAQTAPPSDQNTNAPFHAISSYELAEKHLLEPGDQLFFQILEDKKPPMSLIVTESGELNVPYIGRVPVAGKSCRTLASELKSLLEKDYYYRATVVIALDGMTKVTKVDRVIGRVLIMGEVHSPQSVDILFGRALTLSEAILRAGGFTDSADKKRVKIVRNDGRGSTSVIEVNIAEVMDKGKTEKDIAVEPNDYIIVPTRSIRF
jgi:protein involved in polysaccharide export with SLBB domain